MSIADTPTDFGFVCPFCKRSGRVTEIDGKPGVMHATPMCDRFDTLDVVDYLAAVNAEFSKRKN